MPIEQLKNNVDASEQEERRSSPSHPLISVVIPTYNPKDEILKASLDSVLNQTYRNIEIRLIDDGSETDVFPLVEALNDARIHYRKLPHANANVARNYGMDQSSGSYIAMLDADDLWKENHLDDCLHTLRNSSADGLYGSLILRNPSNQTENTVRVRERRVDESMIDYLLSTGYGAQTSTLFMRAETAKDIRWNPALRRHQDYDFVVRYSKKYRWIPKPEATVIYRMGHSLNTEIDFRSCIRFIKENEKDIHPALYNKYHQNMLSLARRLNASQEIESHYRKEATRCKEYLSYAHFLQIRQPQSPYELLKLKLAYLFYILRIGVETG